MTAKTTRRSSAEWATLVSRQTHSGHTITTFCRHHGLVQPTFMYWRKKLKQQPPPGTGFVPVLPRTADTPKLLLRGRNGVEIEVPPGTPPDTIRQLITALSC
jgi:transposase-like protein